MNPTIVPSRMLLGSLTLRSSYLRLCRLQGRLWLWACVLPALLLPPWLIASQHFGMAGHVGSGTGLVLALLLTVSVLSDLLWRRIFNWATVPAAGWALVLPFIAGRLAPVEALLGLLVCFSVMFFLFCMFQGGAGDVKLVTALGGLLGVQLGLTAMLYGYLLAGVFAVGLLVWRAGLGRVLALFVPVAALLPVAAAPPGKSFLRARLPMAPFFAAGTILALVGG